MKSRKTGKEKNIFLYFIGMFFVFIAINFLATQIPSYITNFATTNKYGFELLSEVFYAIMVLIVMLLFHNSYVFTEKKESFKKSILYAIPILAVSVVMLIQSILSLESFVLGNFVNVLVFCIFVGITEEFLCRGWLQNEFLERFGDTKKNVITSIILSSLIFGLMHATNIISTTQGVFETILQIINATAAGFYFGVIYYKTKNIWSVIILHAFYDFSIFLGEMSFVKDCTYNEPTLGITIVNIVGVLIVSAYWIAGSLLVLKKCDFPNKKASKKKKVDGVLITVVITLFVAMFLPYQELVDGYDDYEVCYTYQETDTLENYVTHYPHFDNYKINYSNQESSLIMNDDNPDSIQEVIVTNDYTFNIIRSDDGKVIIKNENTGYEVTLDYDNVAYYGLEVIENDDEYFILIQTDNVDSTIYYSDAINKNGMSNENDYIDMIAKSFKKYELPLIQQIGYATLEDSDYKYPFFYSVNNDLFIIKNSELYLIK